jgi:hypothetical protein
MIQGAAHSVPYNATAEMLNLAETICERLDWSMNQTRFWEPCP